MLYLGTFGNVSKHSAHTRQQNAPTFFWRVGWCKLDLYLYKFLLYLRLLIHFLALGKLSSLCHVSAFIYILAKWNCLQIAEQVPKFGVVVPVAERARQARHPQPFPPPTFPRETAVNGHEGGGKRRRRCVKPIERSAGTLTSQSMRTVSEIKSARLDFASTPMRQIRDPCAQIPEYLPIPGSSAHRQHRHMSL